MNGYFGQTASFLTSAAGYMRLPALASTGIAAILTSLLYFKQKCVELTGPSPPSTLPSYQIIAALIYPSHMPPNSRTDIPRPTQFGIKDFEELVIPTDDGEKLSAYYIRGPRSGKNSDITILMFHGNAGNIGHRLPIARVFINMIGCNVFMLEYRGYGASTGEPDESGLGIDAQTGLNYLRERAETRNHRFVVYGQSLGGAVSIKLVAKNQDRGDIAGLVLENTFLSMRKLIPSVLPPAKYFTLLCHQIWPSESLLPSISKVPILFLSGLQDEIIPHMAQLYNVSTSFSKTWKTFPGGDHNSSVLEEGYFEAISDFIADSISDAPITDSKAQL
ncbi:bem46 [Trichoderma cornu-damae]|uniref:Bem46 n=1 Tax=Trichoderma cornu-damae TaxID=654480 RepID=A0A9P8QHM7_9HYPO|nr:bem46 [Trichoderma cornu-damae]